MAGMGFRGSNPRECYQPTSGNTTPPIRSSNLVKWYGFAFIPGIFASFYVGLYAVRAEFIIHWVIKFCFLPATFCFAFHLYLT